MRRGTTEFHLEQVRAVRAEIQEKLKELRANERYALVGVGTVWAFMLSTVHAKDRGTDQWTFWADVLAWWFPVLLAAFGLWRSSSIEYSIDKAAKYISQAEQSV